MVQHSAVDEITEEAVALHRMRVICRMVREEGILAHNPHLVLLLANNLLMSLRG